MTEQPAAAAPRETPIEHVAGWFRDHHGQVEAAAKDAAAVADELKPLLAGHASGVLALAAKVLGSPELKAIAPDVLELALSALQIAGVAL